MSTPIGPFDRDEVVRRAKASQINVVNTCQLWTRTICGAPSAGDFDGDGASDAEDGWKSEPAQYKHTDRHPPAGVPVAYLGGSRDNGHRAISLGNGMIRSTDAAGWGHVGTVSLDWPERTWGLTYAGWSETCDGVLIPKPAPPAPKPLSDEEKAAVIRHRARTATSKGHKKWAARLRLWADRVLGN